jgi:hypothetical protein
MNDFFAALAARIVRRSDEQASEAVRPRLPALFEPTAPDATVGAEESVQNLTVAAPGGAADSLGSESASAESRRPAAPARSTSTPSLSVVKTDSLARPTEQPVSRVAVVHAVPPPQTVLLQSVAPTASPARDIDWLAPDHSRPSAPTLPPLPLVETKRVVATSTTIVRSTMAPPALAPVKPEASPIARVAASHPSREAPLAPRVAASQPSREAPLAPRVARSFPPRASAPALTPPETTLHVTIGRVDVRAATPQPERRSAPAASPVMSLEEYLQSWKSRSGR